MPTPPTTQASIEAAARPSLTVIDTQTEKVINAKKADKLPDPTLLDVKILSDKPSAASKKEVLSTKTSTVAISASAATTLPIESNPTPDAGTAVDASVTSADCARLRKKTLGKMTEATEQYQLGRCYQTTEADQTKAWPCFEKAAASGHAASNYELGRAMLNDNTQTRNALQAIKCLETAAQAGIAEAQWLLGSTLMTGASDIPRDKNRAKMWLTRYKSNSLSPQ